MVSLQRHPTACGTGEKPTGVACACPSPHEETLQHPDLHEKGQLERSSQEQRAVSLLEECALSHSGHGAPASDVLLFRQQLSAKAREIAPKRCISSSCAGLRSGRTEAEKVQTGKLPRRTRNFPCKKRSQSGGGCTLTLDIQSESRGRAGQENAEETQRAADRCAEVIGVPATAHGAKPWASVDGLPGEPGFRACVFEPYRSWKKHEKKTGEPFFKTAEGRHRA